MFVDEAKVYVKAGDGGNGCHSFYRDKYNRKGSPDGGPGGDGGDIILAVDKNVQTLLDFQFNQHIEGNAGGHGSSSHKKGARGEDFIVKVPPGTIVRDEANGLLLRDLVAVGDTVIVARGGRGGRGNSRGHDATKGSPGEEKTFRLELKVIADVGLIGYPNAGKSTLITRISHARPKIANYPFTTKAPVLGVVSVGGAQFVVADIPGLIEGAHAGRGLGDRFLRHIERTKMLVHMIDVSGFEGRDPYEDYVKLNKELELYSAELGKKDQIIALNKTDMPGADAQVAAFKRKMKRTKVYPISALAGDGVAALLKAVVKKVEETR